MNKILILAVTGIAIFVGSSMFNLGYVKGVQSLLIAGTHTSTYVDDYTATEPLNASQLCIDNATGAISFVTTSYCDSPAPWTVPLQSNANDYLQQTNDPQRSLQS